MSGLDDFKENENKGKLKEVIELIIFLVVLVLIFKFLLMSVRVSGSSMEPTFVNGERGIILRSNPLNNPKQNSVVVADVKLDDDGVISDARIVKRVFALPKDTFEIKDNQIYVNDEKIEDTYRANGTIMKDYPKITLESEEYFILGDNRDVSRDSREFGPIKRNAIQATRGVVYWPINKIGLMD